MPCLTLSTDGPPAPGIVPTAYLMLMLRHLLNERTHAPCHRPPGPTPSSQVLSGILTDHTLSCLPLLLETWPLLTSSASSLTPPHMSPQATLSRVKKRKPGSPDPTHTVFARLIPSHLVASHVSVRPSSWVLYITVFLEPNTRLGTKWTSAKMSGF